MWIWIHWICSIMKIYIIYNVPAQIVYLGKILFLRYSTKYSNQSDCKIFKAAISPEQIDKTASFIFACWYKFTKIRCWLKFFWSHMVKDGCHQSGLWTLKLTISWKWTDVVNWFFACWYKFMQIKRWLKILGGACSKMGVASLVTGL